MPPMGDARQTALWLVRERGAIDAGLRQRPEAARLAPSGPEAEALRRFRSFVLCALAQGDVAAPALDGLRVPEPRAAALLEGWVDAAVRCAEADGPALRAQLLPLLARFRDALRQSAPARRASGAPRTRRAVAAAIDRVADAFLAVDAADVTICDANPAAGALLGTSRDALLGACVLDYVAEDARDGWRTELDAVAEGSEPRRFRSALRDRDGRPVDVEASVTRFATRSRTLALFVARPCAPTPASS